jgi:hypothetical protein
MKHRVVVLSGVFVLSGVSGMMHIQFMSGLDGWRDVLDNKSAPVCLHHDNHIEAEAPTTGSLRHLR